MNARKVTKAEARKCPTSEDLTTFSQCRAAALRAGYILKRVPRGRGAKIKGERRANGLLIGFMD
jgi:hypothetical protein